MIYLAPYDVRSKSCRLLAEELQCKRIRPRGSRFRPRDDKFIINWGRRDTPFNVHLNPTDSVCYATNKVLTQRMFDANHIPTFTLYHTMLDAQLYLDAVPGDRVILGRMNGLQGGRGIDIYRSGDTILYQHDFYSVLQPSDTEYRVHVVCGKILLVTEKRQRRGMKEWWDDNKRIIRCHDNNWVFCKNNVTTRPEVVSVARDALEALELDFGAVDILWHERQGPTVLEVNTAPGLEGPTAKLYADEFRRVYNDE